MSPSILVIGANGSVGRFLLDELTGHHEHVRVLTWGPDETRELQGIDAIEIVEAPNREPIVLDQALSSTTHVVLLSPPSPEQVTLHGSVVEAAERTGRPVHMVLVLRMGILPPDSPLQVARWQSVTEAQIQSTGLPWTTVRTQILMQTLLRAQHSIQMDNMICGSFGTSRLPQIDARDVASAVASIVQTQGHESRSYVLTGPQAMSYAEIASVFSRELKRPTQYVDMPAEAYHEHLVGGGMAQWMADDLAALARLFREGTEWPVSSTLTELTGRPARTVQQFIKDYAADFQSINPEPNLNGSPVSYAVPF